MSDVLLGKSVADLAASLIDFEMVALVDPRVESR
jgi:hypothetical protein